MRAASKFLKAVTNTVVVNAKEQETRRTCVSFKQNMEENAHKKKTDIVLALDFPYQKAENRATLLTNAQTVLEAVNPYVCAVKINLTEF